MEKRSLTKICLKASRLIALVSVVCFLSNAPSIFAQTPIPCGQLTTGSISTNGQENRHTFTASAGDVVTLRLVRTTNNFTPQMQLLFGAQLLQTSTSQINRALTQTGTYTIAIRYSFGTSQTGAYSLIWQRPKNPCGAIQIGQCQTVKGNISGPGDLDAYTFNGATGQTVVLQLKQLTTNFDLSSDLELYDPDGTLLTSFSGINISLTKTGVYTILIGTNLSDGMAGNYILTLGNLGVLLATPNGGEIFLAGSSVPIKWRSFANSPLLAAHDILLSSDGGATFPTAIVSGISSTAQSYDWRISPNLATNNARIRVIARDSAGARCQDDSDTSFTVAGLASMTPVAYKYDELSRLTQAVYDDGTGITYTYDAAGNRLTEVVAPVPFFKVACNPGTVNTPAPTTCTVTSLNGFNSPVTIGCADAPPGVTCGLSPLTVTPPANGSVNSTVTVSANSTVPTGTYSFQARGTGGGFTRAFNMRLSVPFPSLRFSASTYVVAENGGSVQIVVTRTGSNPVSAMLDYTTSDSAGLTPCSTVNGIASSRCDYATSVGTLRFAGGETSKTIYIPIIDDNFSDGNESFTISLGNPSSASLGTPASATITITDNANTAGNPIDSVPFFVREHYIDFLGREPDPIGYQGWQNILNNCGTTVAPPCDRIEVSSGFFRSEEFQTRGYFIYRFSSAVGKIPLYDGFMPDFAKVSGFLSAQQLEENKVAFVNEFMTRPDFQNKYGSLNDPIAYVNALLQTVGLPNHPSRAAWITALTNQTLTRGQVLRQLVESSEVYQKYYNEAFVIMQYFGYLRRSADISYLEWIQTMNQTGGDYRTMINGFMNSIEYRQRFGN